MEEKRCARCGRPAVTDFEGEPLCEECYQIAGSCCLEFGGEDLSEESVESKEEKKEEERD